MKGLYNYWFEFMVFLMIFPIVHFGVYLGFFIPILLGRYLFILLCSAWIINAIDVAFKQLDMYLATIGINTEEDIMKQMTRYVWAFASEVSDRIVEDE